MGSSSTSSGEPIASAHAIASRCRPPPDRRSGFSAAPLPQAHPAQRDLGAGQHVGHRHPQILGAEGHLVEQRAGDELRVGVLEHHRHAGAQLGDRGGRRVEPVERDRSGEGRGHGVRDQAVEREGEGRLARSARAEHEHHFAGSDVERDLDGGRGIRSLVRDREVAHFEERSRAGAHRGSGGSVALGCGHGLPSGQVRVGLVSLALPSDARQTPMTVGSAAQRWARCARRRRGAGAEPTASADGRPRDGTQHGQHDVDDLRPRAGSARRRRRSQIAAAITDADDERRDEEAPRLPAPVARERRDALLEPPISRAVPRIAARPVRSHRARDERRDEVRDAGRPTAGAAAPAR